MLRAPGHIDPKSVIAVGGGRKNWMNEASQMPDARVRHDFPDVAKRMRQITPERVQQAREDDDRISDGLAPLHPELAQIWPDVYGKAKGVTVPLTTPKAPRVRHDPASVTGLDHPTVAYLKAGLRNQSPSAYSFSADTGRLAVTPAPRGKPGGPGLYGVKGNMHSPYLQQIVKALIRKGMPPGRAYAVAWGSMRRWAGKSKHPEVRAAAAGGLALEKVAEARAHTHAWDGVAGAVELAAAVATAGKTPAPAGPSLYDRYVAQVQQLQAAVALRMQAASAKKAIAASGVKVPPAPVVPAPVAASKPKAAAVPAVAAKQGPPAAAPTVKAAVPPAAAAPKPAPGSPPAAPAKAPAPTAAAPAAPAPSGTPGAPPTVPQLQAKIAALTAQLAALIKSSAPAAKPAPPAGGQSHATPRAGAVELAPTTGQPRQAGGGQQSAAQKAEPRVPAGQAGGGRFGTGGQSAAKPKPDAHQQHVAHVAHQQAQAKKKAGLLSTAKTDRAKAAALMAQRKALQAELASASGATSSGQSGSTTSSGASTTTSTAPAAASTSSTASSTAASSSSSSTAAPTASQLTTQIAGLTTQINALLASAAQATAQAAKM